MIRTLKIIFPACLLILIWSTLALGQANANFPLVIVIHGIGEGNRNAGWSREFANAWGVETHEVTFRYEGRTEGTSYVDFGRKAGDWALSAQKQIQDIVRQNPGRRVMIVSHSWGTVITKLALEGGTTSDGSIGAINLGGTKVEEWVTLGSPLGDSEVKYVSHVEVDDGQPKAVKHWTNFYDVNDIVSNQSHNLTGANNIKLDSGKNALSAHTGIWTDPEVRKHIWNEALRISNMPRLSAMRVGDVTAPPAEKTKPGTSIANDEQIVAEYRSLLPLLLQKNKKPWHTRINIVANAEQQGDKYHVNYQTYCLIETGPDTGKDHMCYEFETMLDLGGIKSAVADMKRQLGR